MNNLELIENTENIWSAEIPSEYVGPRGLEYYVQASYPGGNAVSPDSGQKYPAISSVKNLSGNFIEATKAKQYQMISLPLDAGKQSIDDLFGDILGPYDNTKYRIFDWDPSFEVYEESSDMNDTLTAGKSLWLITSESTQMAYANCTSISSDEYYEINLHQGWNMIASPFAFDIDISEINKTPLQGEVIFEYDNGLWIPRQDSVLVPFRGYAVNAQFAATLLIPNTEAGQGLGKESLDSEQGWYIQLMATGGNLQDNYNFAGANSRSKNGWDHFDYPEPPKIGEFVELYFKQDQKNLTGDFRTIGGDGYIYSFMIQSDRARETIIEVMPFNLPDNYTWQIIAPESGVKYTSDVVHLSSGSQEYKLVVGKTDFVEHSTSGFKNLPESFQLAQNYPNPFNPETRVRFELPKASKISMDIYDIMGRKIKSLSGDDYRQAGYYEVMWNGKNDQGRNVASGLYLLYLRTAEYKKAIKMILQR